MPGDKAQFSMAGLSKDEEPVSPDGLAGLRGLFASLVWDLVYAQELRKLVSHPSPSVPSPEARYLRSPAPMCILNHLFLFYYL